MIRKIFITITIFLGCCTQNHITCVQYRECMLNILYSDNSSNWKMKSIEHNLPRTIEDSITFTVVLSIIEMESGSISDRTKDLLFNERLILYIQKDSTDSFHSSFDGMRYMDMNDSESLKSISRIIKEDRFFLINDSN
jgi:hypothetical protein